MEKNKAGKGDKIQERGVILSLSGKILLLGISEQRLDRGTEANCQIIQRKYIPGRGKCKGPEEGVNWGMLGTVTSLEWLKVTDHSKPRATPEPCKPL